MPEGIPHVATIKGVSATGGEINDEDKQNEILEEDSSEDESKIIPNIKTDNLDSDDITSINNTMNNNLDDLSTASEDTYNTDEKDNKDEGTTINNEINNNNKLNNTNEDKSNIPLYE